MKRSYKSLGVASLVLAGLAAVAFAAGPTLMKCGGKCGGCKKAPDGSKSPSACPKDGPTTAPADGKVVNARCPIMGAKLDRDNVPAKLTRTFHDKKVGFCCGGCPAKWDKLTEEQKEAKLKAAM